MGAQAAKEQFVASALTPEERQQLNMLLRRMVVHTEQAASPPAEVA